MLIGQRENQAVVGGSSLQFKIEGEAETFPQGESPGASDPGAEGCVQNNCIPPA
jgi:hypothetical protein